jgi:rhamnosyltransferase subunit B
MHFLVSALGSAGDVHPFIAVSQALRARGHDVRMVAAAAFGERIARAGIAFTPLGTVEVWQRLLQRPELWDARRAPRLVLDELLASLAETHAVLSSCLADRRDTVLVGSTLSWATRLLQERTGLPGATVHLSPLLLPSAVQPPIQPGIGDLSWLPAWLLRVLYRALDRWLAPRLNQVRAQLGLPPVRQVWSRWMHAPDLVVAAWPSWFAPTQPDWPAQTVTTGFVLYPEAEYGAPPDAALEAFLDGGAAPIGITPGSAMAHGGRFLAHALDACRALGRRALLVTPYRDALPSPLPADAHHVDYVPFARLLPRLAALIHHGGIGTSAQALAAGIPQLVAPFAHDQFDNAARLCRLGVATSVRQAAPPAAWLAALRDLLDTGAAALAAKRCAERMAGEAPAAELIAQRLERLGAERGC